MRRKWAAAMLAAGLFAVGACGDDGDGGNGEDEPPGKSTEEVCTDVEAAATEMQTAVGTAATEAAAAMEAEDQAAALTAAQDMQTAISDFTETLRTNADEAEEQETADTLNTAADDLDGFVEGIDIEALQAGEMPDTTALETSTAAVDEMCANA